MHRLLSLIIFAILATFSLAAPLPASKAVAKRSFRIPVKGRNKLAPAAAMAQLSLKYGFETVTFEPTTSDDTAEAQSQSSGSSSGSPSSSPASSDSSSGSGGEGDVTAKPEENDQEYLSPVSIGGQTLNLDLDTGSSDLWVFSTNLPSGEDTGHTLFDPSKSQTWSAYQGGSWKTSYGDNSGATGTVGFDTVNIGGTSVEKQCIELADNVSSQFQQDTKSDGIVGLGFSSINQVSPQRQKTFFDNVMDDLDQPVFTVLLEDTVGDYEFGTIDSSKYSGNLQYAAVDSSQGYWQFQTPTYSVGGVQKQCTSTGCGATIVDTGTSLMLMDQEVVQAYYSQVQGAKIASGGYEFPCDASLPDFSIEIGNSGYSATVQGSDLNYEQMTDGSCYGGLQSNQGIGIAVLGDVFLKDHFAVFDGGNLRFGIAEKA